MSFCFQKLEKYQNAIIALKYMLCMAWACKSTEAEYSAYEGLTRMHMYLGNMEKVKFYDAKVTLGHFEKETSKGYKVHVHNVLAAHPWLKETKSRLLDNG